ncbi:hypothetical protein DSECCO2_638830 [anaerobic digester metagenome]
MERCVGPVEGGVGNDPLDGIDDPADPLDLARKAVREFPAHHHGCGLCVWFEEIGERCPLPERAVVDMHAGIVDDLEVRTADIDADHTRLILPPVSNRTLPERCTSPNASPCDALKRMSAISSSMMAAMPTRLVVGLGLTSTT